MFCLLEEKNKNPVISFCFDCHLERIRLWILSSKERKREAAGNFLSFILVVLCHLHFVSFSRNGNEGRDGSQEHEHRQPEDEQEPNKFHYKNQEKRTTKGIKEKRNRSRKKTRRCRSKNNSQRRKTETLFHLSSSIIKTTRKKEEMKRRRKMRDKSSRHGVGVEDDITRDPRASSQFQWIKLL